MFGVHLLLIDLVFQRLQMVDRSLPSDVHIMPQLEFFTFCLPERLLLVAGEKGQVLRG